MLPGRQLKLCATEYLFNRAAVCNIMLAVNPTFQCRQSKLSIVELKFLVSFHYIRNMPEPTHFIETANGVFCQTCWARHEKPI